MKLVDLKNNKYGRLLVLNYAFSKNGRRYWHCKCECGNEKDIIGKDMQNGKIRSCGCLAKENPNRFQKTHGSTDTRLYRIWCTMKQRTLKPSTIKAKKDYFDRGITLYKEWENFEIFQKWAFENGYSDNLTIDRIENNGNYCPENCRWVDIKTQANNKRNNRFITYNGKTQTVAQWAGEIGMKYNCLDLRLCNGWSIEDALTIPVGGRRKKCQ